MEVGSAGNLQYLIRVENNQALSREVKEGGAVLFLFERMVTSYSGSKLMFALIQLMNKGRKIINL